MLKQGKPNPESPLQVQERGLHKPKRRPSGKEIPRSWIPRARERGGMDLEWVIPLALRPSSLEENQMRAI